MWQQRPDRSEYADFYHTYVKKVPQGDVLVFLEQQRQRARRTLSLARENRADFRYAPEKWSVKEVLGHMIDAERIFAFRALCFARRDPGPFPGMDQDEYMVSAPFARQQLPELIEEFDLVRQTNILLFRGFDTAALQCRGTASDAEVSVRALVYIIAGHAAHHLEILSSRYL